MVKIPYNKKHEEKSRKLFENNTYGRYPSNPKYAYPEDLSDGGEQIEGINSQIDRELALKQLSQRQKSIAEAILAGYNQTEIAKQLKVNQATISREMHKVRCILRGGF